MSANLKEFWHEPHYPSELGGRCKCRHCPQTAPSTRLLVGAGLCPAPVTKALEQERAKTEALALWAREACRRLSREPHHANERLNAACAARGLSLLSGDD